MREEEIREMMDYYREQGAPQDQQMLIALLREAQEAEGGVLTHHVLGVIAQAYAIKREMLLAIIRRIPGMRLETAPHRLEVCGTCRAGANLRAYIERTYGVKSGAANEAAGFSYHVTPCMKNCRFGPSVRWDGTLYSHADEKLVSSLIQNRG